MLSFSKKEMTRFVAFCHSPYHCKHEHIRTLVNYLEGLYPEFNEKKLARRVVFQALFPGEPHNQAKLAVVFTYTLRMIEEFLVVEQLRDASPEAGMFFLKKLRQKRLSEYYEKALQRRQEKLADSTYRNSDFFKHKLAYASEADIYYYSQLSRHKKDLSIQEKQDYLDLYFLAEKLKDACEMRLRKKILLVDYEAAFLEPILKACELQGDYYLSFPAISLYYNLYLLVDQDKPSHYFQAKAILQDDPSLFPLEELDSIYKYLQHFCIDRINHGESDFLKELFGIFQTQLEKGLLIENGFLSEWHYKNIVTTGLRLDERQWVDEFIESYKGRLRPESRENAYIFNKAAYYYEIGHYEQVLDMLQHVEYTDIRYQLGAKSILLRTYYDLAELDAFLSLADSFRQYLHRNQLLSEERRKGHLNLIRFARRIFSLKIDAPYQSTAKNQQEIQNIRKGLTQSDILFNQSWLNQKVSELEKNL